MLNRSRFIYALAIIGLIGTGSPIRAQSNTWMRKNDVAYNGMDGPRIGYAACRFSVGEKGYVLGTGNTFWEYDPTTDAWTARAPFPGGFRGGAACFAINSKGYISAGSNLTDTWEYDPVGNTWTAKAAFPGLARSSTVGFSIGDKGYLGTGLNTGSGNLKDFWEFDPVANTWTQKADFLGAARYEAVGFSVGGKGYIGAGWSAGGSETWYKNFCAYDPITNTWTAIADLYYRRSAVGFGIGSKGYVCTGLFGTSGYNDVQEYDPALNTWTYKGSFGDNAGRRYGFGFATSTRGYVGGGQYYGNNVKRYDDFWEFDPATASLTPRQYLGGMAMENCGALAIGAKALFTAGGRYGDLVGSETWQYTPATNAWQKRPNVYFNREGSSTFTIGDVGYKVGGFRVNVNTAYAGDVSRYDNATDTWSYTSTISARGLAVGFSSNGKGYVGLGTNGTNKNDLWQYDPAANAWTQKANFPGAARQGAVAFRIGNKVYVGTGFSTVLHRDMWMYDPAQDTWTQKADFGGTARRGAVAFTLGGKGYIATGDDGAKRNDLWEYDPVTDTWLQKADFGGAARSNAMSFVVGAKAYVGTGSTGPSAYAYDMWEYTAVDAANAVQVRPKVFLEGPYNSGTGLMSDALRTAGLIPLGEPYTALGYEHVSSGGESTTPAVLAVPGNNAIVDWVIVELRHALQPSLVVATACAFVQRDGDVVGADGTSPVRLFVGAGNYYVAVRHRNHLGAMTASTVALTPAATTVDLTSSSTATYGSNARKTVGAVQVLWAGDVTRNGILGYTGSGNDRDPILVRVGATTPNATAAGYYSEDITLDGVVSYAGSGNDRDPILVNVGNATPNNTKVQQLP